jgi:hypothetical protein
MNATTWRRIAVGASALAGALIILIAARSRAAGIPEADGMTYTGYLESSEGTPLTGEHSIAVQFWDSESAKDDVCMGKLDAAELQSGRFQVQLPLSCSEAVKASPDVWVSVDVDGASLGRTKLGAVPFALEAGHAASASSATDALEDRIGALEARADVQSARIGLDGSEDASWITGVTKNGVGSYQIAFVAGVFATAPACVVTAAVGNSKSPAFECFNASKTGVECRANIHDPNPAALGIAVDAGFSMLCVAPN